MAKREKFGKFVLLEDLETSSLGTEHRAAKLGPAGLEKIVSILRLSPVLSANADAAKSLMDQAKVAAQLQNPNVVRIYGIGKVETVYYVSYEFIEGKSLRAIFERCRRDSFPFSVDHSLLVASKVCSALEYSHGRKTEGGSRYYHGLLNPGNILVSYEGEVRVRGFGHWLARVRETGVLREQDTLYLSPEQAGGAPGDTRSDIFAVGAVLYEALTGQPLQEKGSDVAARLAGARLQSPSAEDDSVPKPIADILARSLAPEASGRYGEIQELRKAIDTLLFSGEFTPTTFNLAFFMHSIFRDDIDRESAQVQEEREASYADFLTDGGPKPTGNTITLNVTPIPTSAAATQPNAEPPPPVPREPPPVTRQIPGPALAPPPPPPEPAAVPPGISAKDAASSFTFHKEEPAKSRLPFVGLVLGILALGGAAYYYFAMGMGSVATPSAPPPTTLSPEAAAALARVKELENQLKAIEEQKAAEEEKAKEEAAAKLQREAKARGTEVDAAALQRAQEEAARKARADQERKAQEERKKIEDAKAAEEQRLAEEQRKVAEQRKAAEAARVAESTTTTQPAAAPPEVRPGTLVNLNDPGVIAPVVEKTPTLPYPILALRQRVEGSVELNILVDERGAVTDAQIVTGSGGRWGLDEAAIESVKKRRYRPATKEGVAVKVWIPVRVQFKLPGS